MRVTSMLIALTILACSAALAATGDISLAGRVVLRIRYPAAGYTIEQRADAIQARINDILVMGPVKPDDVKVTKVNKETAVVVKGELIITADWVTARANKTTPEKLAEIWAENLRSALPESVVRRER